MFAIPPRIPWKLILSIGAIPAIVAVLQLGRIHPDEVYQWLEPAFYRAHGYGILSWEWSAGIRNWAIPIFFGWLLKLCAAIGVSNPRIYRAVLEVPQYFLHVAMLASVYRYSERRIGGEGAAWATALVGLCAPVVVFAGRTMGESFSAAFLVIALAALDRPASKAVAILGGAMLGLAVLARYASGVQAAVAIAYLAIQSRWRPLTFALVGSLPVLAGLGALDWLTWHRPFHSALTYFQFNVLSARAGAQFGAAPAWFYLPVLVRAVPLWVWVGLPFAILKQRPRVPMPLFCGICSVAALSAVAHKEERFIYPVLVLVALVAAPGLVQAVQLAKPRLRSWIAVSSLASNALGFIFPGELRAQRGDQFRAIVRATRPPEASGLLIVNEGIWGAGGFFYIGKRIPWHTCDWPADPAFRFATGDARFNRAVTYEGRALLELEASGFRVAEQIGQATILIRP
jgi:hypothetical protein